MHTAVAVIICDRFDIGRDPLRRVPMMEPLKGTAEHVGALLDECDTAAELLTRLGS